MLKAIHRRRRKEQQPVSELPTSAPGSVPPDATEEQLHEAVDKALEELKNAADRHTEAAERVKHSGLFLRAT